MLLRRIAGVAASAATATALLLAGTGSASAHVSAQMYGSVATSGGYGFTFLRVPHGCAGDATNKVTVQVPPGASGVKPQAKAGWDVSKTKDDAGNILSVTWSGGVLPNDEFDDFGISLKWPTITEGAESEKVYFPTIQECDADLLVKTKGSSSVVSLAEGVYLEANTKLGVFVDGSRIGTGKVRLDGSFRKAFPAAKVPAGAVVEVRSAGETLASSIAGEEAWIQIPAEGEDPHSLDRPAPSVTVYASGGSGH